MTFASLRKSVALQLDPELRVTSGLSPTNKFLIALIVIAGVAAVIETEPLLSNGYDVQFRVLEIGIGSVFLVEYAARLWVAPESPRNAGKSWPPVTVRAVVSGSRRLGRNSADICCLRWRRECRPQIPTRPEIDPAG